MKISISTISYNQSRFIGHCLAGVARARSASPSHLVEHIVVDAISSDGTIDILKANNSLDRLVIERDKGPADGLNKAFSHASGEFGYFINADDFILPDAIARMFKAIDESPNADVILMGGWVVDQFNDPIRLMVPKKVSLCGLLLGQDILFQAGMLFRMDIFRRVGGFNVENRSCWDLELICDMINAGARISVVNDRIGCFRLHSASLSGGVGGVVHSQLYQQDLERLRFKYKVNYVNVLKKFQALMMKIFCKFNITLYWPIKNLKNKVLWKIDNE